MALIGRLALGLSLCLALTSRAYTADRPSSEGAQAASFDLSFLQRIHAASERLTFSGVVVSQQENRVSMSRLSHRWDSGVVHSRLEALDGEPREVVRIGNEVSTYLTGQRVVYTEAMRLGSGFPGLGLWVSEAGRQHYTLIRDSACRVAGLACTIFRLEPKDPAVRYRRLLWVAHESDLLLKVQTLSQSGEVLEQTAFGEVRLGDFEWESSAKPKDTSGWKQVNVTAKALSADQSRWGLSGGEVLGFRPVTRLIRPSATGAELMQLVLSDGFVSVSVFVEKAIMHQGTKEGGGQRGALSMYSHKQGEYWVTALGEVPMLSAKAIAMAVFESRQAFRKD